MTIQRSPAADCGFMVQTRLYLILFTVFLALSDMYLYVNRPVKTDVLISRGYHAFVNLSGFTPESTVHDSSIASRSGRSPRVLYSRIHDGQVFEILHYPGFPQKINLNNASQDLLKTLPGLGEKRARELLLLRAGHGPFRSIQDLAITTRWGSSILSRLTPYICFQD